MKRIPEKGVALIEAALILPVLALLLVGGFFLGFATIDQMRLERVAGDAALLPEAEAEKLIESGGGGRGTGATMVCYWQGLGIGGCFDDGLDIHRTQIVARGRTWQLPISSVTPRVQLSRPIQGETSGETSG